MAHSAHSPATDGDGQLYPNVGHVVPLRILFGVFAALIALTGVTVFLSDYHLGQLDLIVALTIATVKATLVCLYFMHLRWDRPILGVLFMASFFFVAIFMGFVLIDAGQYTPDIESRQLDDPVNLKTAPDAFFDRKQEAAPAEPAAATPAVAPAPGAEPAKPDAPAESPETPPAH